MKNIWLENKAADDVILILLFFLSMNFFHYGQLILPIICIIILKNNKKSIMIYNNKRFIVLCLFAMSFFVFSYKLGFYSVMGFCLPMAYFIGLNIKNTNEESIKKIIYIITSGMAFHYILNFLYEIFRFGFEKVITKATRYDIWLQDEFVSTGTATNAVIILAIIYYVVIKEKSKKTKAMLICLFFISFIYTIILRRKAQLGIFFISLLISLIYDLYKNGIKRNKDIRKIIDMFVVIIIIFFISLICYFYNFFGINYYIKHYSLLRYIEIEGFDSGRIAILFKGFKYLSKYMFGGRNISNIIGLPFHDLLLDIYDYSGAVSSVLMAVYLIMLLITMYNVIKSIKISNDFKIIVISLFISYLIIFCIEPIMTGSSLFLICGVLIAACLEKAIE